MNQPIITKTRFKYIDRMHFNKYNTQKYRLKLGLAHLWDGLVITFTLGRYSSYYSSHISEEIIRNAINIRKQERGE